MSRNRKLSIVILLLFVHALLLVHEVAVNRVLCYKNDGTADLEPAFFGFNCVCKDDGGCGHDHHSTPQPGTPPQLCNQSDGCFDQPLESNWLERNISAGTHHIQFVRQGDRGCDINRFLEDANGSFFQSLPLSKYLDKPPSLHKSVILRC
ncbi:MAG: hypothetical protein GY950_01395 [bacterium]|nr:hypothetical protein [bacterium]